ncbi:MAG: hypothetical protein DIU78_023080 [Pseudomonadota bacterium]|nr:MAG: hypothetical protein DIU78_23615 [Pseudomonadota bacterium]
MAALRKSLVPILLAFAATCGCGAQYVARGAELYSSGEYIEAAEVFERTESRLSDSSASERARYGLYRGATLLALGDVRRAGRWLGYSEELARAKPTLLSEEERVMLRRALDDLAQRARPDDPGSATASALAGRTPAPKRR